MDKAQAVFSFWNNFDLPVYDENSIPTGSASPTMPYITYQTSTGSLEDVISMNASLWYRSTSWAQISQKAEEISNYIGPGGVVIPLDNGYVWIVRGTPFAQRMSDPNDDMIRRIYINIQAEFLTA